MTGSCEDIFAAQESLVRLRFDGLRRELVIAGSKSEYLSRRWWS